MTILVVGDSFSTADPNLPTWPTLIGQRLGQPVISHAGPGCGYIASGIGWPNRFLRQLSWHRDLDPSDVDAVVLFGSVNDWQWVPHDLTHLRLLCVQTLLEVGKVYPNARQLVVGPQWSGPDPIRPELAQVRQAILDAMWCTDWHHPYVDPNPADLGAWWFPPSRPDLWGPDLFHPNAAGQVRIADRIEPALRTVLGL